MNPTETIDLIRQIISERPDTHIFEKPSKTNDVFSVHGFVFVRERDTDDYPLEFDIRCVNGEDVTLCFLIKEKVAFPARKLLSGFLEQLNEGVSGKYVMDENDRVFYSTTFLAYSNDRLDYALNKALGLCLQEIAEHLDAVQRIAKEDYSDILKVYFAKENTVRFNRLKAKIRRFQV